MWSSGAEPWDLGAARVLSGDFTANGKSDIAVQLDLAGGGWRVVVFPGGALGAPTTWHQTGRGDVRHANLVAGDFNGDRFADLAELRDLGGCQTRLLTYRSNGTTFAEGRHQWLSRPGGFCADRNTPVAGDVDGDRRDDIIGVYDHGGSDLAMVRFNPAAHFTPREWWRKTGEFDPAAIAVSTGDFDLDGKDDLAVVQASRTTGQTQLWTLRSTGTAFADRVLGWQETTGGVPDRFEP